MIPNAVPGPTPPFPEPSLSANRRSSGNGRIDDRPTSRPMEPDGLGGRRSVLSWRETVSVIVVLAIGSAWAAVLQYQLHEMTNTISDGRQAIERLAQGLADHVRQPGHQVSMERFDQSAADRADLRQEIRELRTIVLGMQQAQVALRDHLLAESTRREKR